jgi:hypothetical protein
MISCMIETNKIKMGQRRTHAEYYYDQVSVEQSKYIAFHVGIFCGIGRFIIKNGDTVTVMVDLNSMFEHLIKNKKSDDPLMQSRNNVVKQLIDQHEIDIQYQLIEPRNNLASKLLNT